MTGADKQSGRTTSGRDTEGIRGCLDTLEERIAAARVRHAPPPEPETQARGAALGQALRLATEMIAGVAVGGFIGWALDRFLGTAPLLMVVFLILGAAAGILNVVRTAKAMQAEAPPAGKDLPQDVTDDDDD
jgi:ATP synthase protein I